MVTIYNIKCRVNNLFLNYSLTFKFIFNYIGLRSLKLYFVLDRMVHGGIAPRPIGERGSGAARALARSGQSNAPDTCALLNDRSEKLSQASRTIAAKSV